MTDTDRNTRTLVVCFSIAIMALIPLRFVEVGQQMEEVATSVTVLGETTQKEVVLPETRAEAVLEAPYNEIDGSCLSGEQYVAKMELLSSELNKPGIQKSEVEELIQQAQGLDSRRCK